MTDERRRRRSGSRGDDHTTSIAEERAAAQKAARARRAAQASAMAAQFDGPTPGERLLRAALGATGVFVVVSVIAVAVDTRATRRAAATVDLVLFAAGVVLFVVALVWGADRSRRSEMTMAGWWFLAGSAPASVRRVLLGSLATQVVVGLAAASLRPFTALAFGVLVPTLGIAMCGAWSARHGYFPDRAA